MQIALDIINEIEDRLGWPQSTTIESPELTSEQRKLIRLMNRVLSTWTGLDDWALLRTDAEIALIADVTSDTTAGTEQYVTATLNSATITVANMTAFDETYIGRALAVSGSEYVYRIIDVPTPATLTLNRAWVDASITVADERTFTIGADRYSLPTDFDRPTGGRKAFFAPYNIAPVSPEAFARRREGRGISVGEPEVYTIYGMNAGETTELIHFDPYPCEARLLGSPYQKQHKKIDSDNDKIFIQDRYMEAYIEMVLHLALRDYEDDAKSQATLADMVRIFNQQRANPAVTEEPSVMRPRNQTRADIRRAANMAGVRIDWKSHFDKVENTGLS